jgi:hypothetical protein
MGLFGGITDSLFGTKSAPTLSQTDYSQAAQQGATYNQSQIPEFENYGTGLTQYMSNLFNKTVNPQALSAQNTQYNLGNQLATTGQTSAMGNFEQYARQMGLQNAAATGAPLSGSFAQGLGTNLSEQQILQNQLQGSNMLGAYAQNQQGLAQSFAQPALGVLNASLVNPQVFMQGAAANNAIANQNSYINYANSRQQSFLGNLLTGAAESAISTPFSSFENMNSFGANAPQEAMQMCGGGGGGGGGNNSFANAASQNTANNADDDFYSNF